MTKTLIKKNKKKKIPLFLLITNSFRGPFKTKTKENLLPPGSVSLRSLHSSVPLAPSRRCSNNKSNQVGLFYSDFNFFRLFFSFLFWTTIMTFIPNNCVFSFSVSFFFTFSHVFYFPRNIPFFFYKKYTALTYFFIYIYMLHNK